MSEQEYAGLLEPELQVSLSKTSSVPNSASDSRIEGAPCHWISQVMDPDSAVTACSAHSSRRQSGVMMAVCLTQPERTCDAGRRGGESR